jgi:molybdopterin-guanine dinucleotide biosynthesis protein B
MKKIHIVGRRNHGKTDLIVELVQELTGRGLKVGTIKHSGHVHELDTPGKDSYRLRIAGGSPAAVASEELTAVFMPRKEDEDVYQRLDSLYAECDLVLVEGDYCAEGLKLEVWKKDLGSQSLATERDGSLAVITDDPLEADIPVWPRSDVSSIADKIVGILLGEKE